MFCVLARRIQNERSDDLQVHHGLKSDTMALITSDCDAMKCSSIKRH